MNSERILPKMYETNVAANYFYQDLQNFTVFDIVIMYECVFVTD